jgi:hypothetical protein
VLLSLGITGEYIARIIDLAEYRPAYFVRESLEANDDVDEAGAIQASKDHPRSNANPM